MWENVKGTVGWQLTTKTTLKDVKTHLIAAFVQLQPKTVSGCILKSNNHFQDLLEHILAMGNILKDSDDNNDDDRDKDRSAISE